MVFDTVADGAGDIAALIIISIQHRLQTNEKRPHPAMVRAKIRIQNSMLHMARTRVGGGGGVLGRGKRKEGDDNLLPPVMSVENHEGLIDDLEGSPNVQYDAPPTEIPQPTYKRLFLILTERQHKVLNVWTIISLFNHKWHMRKDLC